ncbi:MAG: cupin domain-containing protein [Polyangiales bacterium]
MRRGSAARCRSACCFPIRYRDEHGALRAAADCAHGGTPHTPGTREYLACERGRIELVASGTRYVLEPGDVVAFRGDQKHSYANPGKSTAVGYSVVLLVSPLVPGA